MSKKLTTSQVIKDFKEVHGELYDYSLVEYQGYQHKVKIICKVHGVFKQKPNNHKNGQRCYYCYGNVKLSTKEVIQQFQKIHSNQYDYSLVVYINNRSKVDIICKTHGSFSQEPRHHKTGVGCPYCKQLDRYNNRKVYLYYIKIENQYKIGVCLQNNHSIQQAIKNRYNKEYKTNDIILLKFELFEDGREAYNLEQSIIKNNSDKLIHKEDMILNSGWTETFTEDIRWN